MSRSQLEERSINLLKTLAIIKELFKSLRRESSFRKYTAMLVTRKGVNISNNSSLFTYSVKGTGKTPLHDTKSVAPYYISSIHLICVTVLLVIHLKFRLLWRQEAMLSCMIILQK